MFSASPTTKYDTPEEIAVLAKQITMSWNEKKVLMSTSERLCRMSETKKTGRVFSSFDDHL